MKPDPNTKWYFDKYAFLLHQYFFFHQTTFFIFKVAFISHIGTSHLVGHYVCHILKEGRWVIFNDSKVALSENPPKGMGYLYLYERVNK